MAQDALPHIETLKTTMYSLAHAPVITNTCQAVIDVDQPKTSSSRAELTAVDPQEMARDLEKYKKLVEWTFCIL